MLGYIKDCYEIDPAEYESDEDYVPYDLSYCFGDTVEAGSAVFYADREQAEHRQLQAHYPTKETTLRCAVMDYYGEEANENINELWSRIKAETRDGWALAVHIVAAVLIVAVPLFAKFGGKLDFRGKPKKGYKLIKQENIRHQ